MDSHGLQIYDESADLLQIFIYDVETGIHKPTSYDRRWVIVTRKS